jgi:hypothetical protein
VSALVMRTSLLPVVSCSVIGAGRADGGVEASTVRKRMPSHTLLRGDGLLQWEGSEAWLLGADLPGRRHQLHRGSAEPG